MCNPSRSCVSKKKAKVLESGNSGSSGSDTNVGATTSSEVTEHLCAQDPLAESEQTHESTEYEHDYYERASVELNNIEPEEFQDFLDLGADITVEQLESIKGCEHNSLRKKLGLLYHIRLGHASLEYLEKAKKTFDALKNVNFSDELKDCEVCKLSKISRIPHNKVRDVATAPLVRVHSDLMGKISPVGIKERSIYVLTFTDDFSRYTMTYCLREKTSGSVFSGLLENN